jgi:hypothetical protein
VNLLSDETRHLAKALVELEGGNRRLLGQDLDQFDPEAVPPSALGKVALRERLPGVVGGRFPPVVSRGKPEKSLTGKVYSEYIDYIWYTTGIHNVPTVYGKTGGSVHG